MTATAASASASAVPASDPAAGGGAGAGVRPGLRGRKRERTRRSIADAAFRLFAERGFDGVTLVQIAAEAEVAPATVFTHYASKDDIFFSRRQEFAEALPGAVVTARTGAELVEGLRGYYAANVALVLAPEEEEASRTFARILLASPALHRFHLAVVDERRAMLLDLLVERAGEAGRDPAVRAELALFAWSAGAAGAAASEEMRIRLAAGDPLPGIGAAVLAVLASGFTRLAAGYADSPLLVAAARD
ncbi:TetR/AcrR family transcriptional regulator [Kitasatospora sp. MBT63]|uniref:TetR/AcrR family transcriptional regulator n=1 Tax=Kitasatospora sp. MBT63 TaxID=1444768 RepID=UPI00068E3E4D|nr:TetR/AcrR family transcriptional regulator [Kitasatospora sp. MBT63]